MSNPTKVNPPGSHQAAPSPADVPALMAESAEQQPAHWERRMVRPKAQSHLKSMCTGLQAHVEPQSMVGSRVEPPSAVDSRRHTSNTGTPAMVPTHLCNSSLLLPPSTIQPSQTRHSLGTSGPLLRPGLFSFSSPPGKPYSPARLSLSHPSLIPPSSVPPL